MHKSTNENTVDIHNGAGDGNEEQEYFEVIGYFLDYKSKEEALEYLAEELFKRGFVNDDYGKAVLEREIEFPTGLPTSPVPVAIPHSDRRFVTQSGIAIAKMKSPIVFKNMGEPEEELNVALIFLLAVSRDESQVLLIKSVLEIVQDKDILQDLIDAKSESELVEIFRRNCEYIKEKG